MGEQADYIIEDGYYQLGEDIPLEDEVENHYWTTKSGEAILIQDLTDEHLDNILKMAIRENWGMNSQLHSLIEESKRRQENVR